MEGRVSIYDYDQAMLAWRAIPNLSHMVFARDVKHYRRAGVFGFFTESRGAMATMLYSYTKSKQIYICPSSIAKADDIVLTEQEGCRSRCAPSQ